MNIARILDASQEQQGAAQGAIPMAGLGTWQVSPAEAGSHHRTFQGLGMIPSWQFSNDPAINIKINPHVRFPPGWNQRTVQPVGPFYAPPQVQFNGLGGVFDSGFWKNRKWLVLGGVGLLGIAATALLR